MSAPAASVATAPAAAAPAPAPPAAAPPAAALPGAGALPPAIEAAAPAAEPPEPEADAAGAGAVLQVLPVPALTEDAAVALAERTWPNRASAWRRVCETRDEIAKALLPVAGSGPQLICIGVGVGAAASAGAPPSCAGAAKALVALSLEQRAGIELLFAQLADRLAELEAVEAESEGDAHSLLPPALLRGDAEGEARGGAEAVLLRRLATSGFVPTQGAADALRVARLHVTAEMPVAQRGALLALLRLPLPGAAVDAPPAIFLPGLELLRGSELFAAMLGFVSPPESVLRMRGVRNAIVAQGRTHPTLKKDACLDAGAIKKLAAELALGAISAATAERLIDNRVVRQDERRVEHVLRAASPPPLGPEVDSALALCDAFVFARIGSYNMRASSAFTGDPVKGSRKVLSLAAVAARERWSCAALQEMPCSFEGIEAFRAQLREQEYFARWAVSTGKRDPSFQGGEAPCFIYDRRCWSPAKGGVASLDLDSLDTASGSATAAEAAAEAAAAASAAVAGAQSAERFLRRPALLFLHSAAQPDRVLALVSVHARPDKNHARSDARLLGKHIHRWVTGEAEKQHISQGAYVTVVTGDHNIAAQSGNRPDPDNAWGYLTGPAGFNAVPFAAGAARATNAYELLVDQAQFEYDHAFVSRAACLTWPVSASARVCDVAAAPFSMLAAEYSSMTSAFALMPEPHEPLVTKARTELKACLEKLREDACAEHVGLFSDHKPITVMLLKSPLRAPEVLPPVAPLEEQLRMQLEQLEQIQQANPAVAEALAPAVAQLRRDLAGAALSPAAGPSE